MFALHTQRSNDAGTTPHPVGGPWVYYAYPSETSDDAFGPLSSAVRLWRSKCPAPGVFPAWKDFDILDLEGWWGQISLAEMRRDPLDLRWALWGTRLTHWWGMDYTGKIISEQPHIQSVWSNQERGYMERLIDERRLGFVTGNLRPQGRDFLYIHGVDLPLEKDGVVSHVMSVYRLRDETDDFVPDAPPSFIA